MHVTGVNVVLNIVSRRCRGLEQGEGHRCGGGGGRASDTASCVRGGHYRPQVLLQVPGDSGRGSRPLQGNL